MPHVKCYNYEKKGYYPWDCLEPPKVPFYTYSPELYVRPHAVVSNSFPNWIVDTRASKHIVRAQADFVDFHLYIVGSRTIMLGNGSEEDVLEVRTYKLKLRGGSMLLLLNAFCTPRI